VNHARSEHRYALAAALMDPPLEDASLMPEVIACMDEPEREHLRELVDWVEDYERHEAK
jgi:hypothetical protein